MPRSPALTDDERALMLAWSQQNITLAEQARRLKRPVSNLVSTRRKLIRARLISCPVRPPRRSWRPADHDLLFHLIDTGHGYDEIAQKLSRSRTAIILECRRRKRRPLDTSAAMTARDAAHLLGKGCQKTVSAWIKRGLLKARNAGRPDRPIWRNVGRRCAARHRL